MTSLMLESQPVSQPRTMPARWIAGIALAMTLLGAVHPLQASAAYHHISLPVAARACKLDTFGNVSCHPTTGVFFLKNSNSPG